MPDLQIPHLYIAIDLLQTGQIFDTLCFENYISYNTTDAAGGAGSTLA